MNRILVIDHHPAVRRAVAALLESSGRVVRMAPDAAGALRECATFAPDIVLLDLRLPGANCFDVVLELRARDPLVSIVAMSGGAAFEPEPCVEAVRRMHAVVILPKPFTAHELLATVEAASLLAAPRPTEAAPAPEWA